MAKAQGSWAGQYTAPLRFCRWHLTAALLPAITSFTGLYQPALADPPDGGKITLDSVGYLPRSIKQATVVGGGDESFVVRDALSDREVFRDRLKPGPLATAASAHRIADFSKLQQPGAYRLQMGGAMSPVFLIGDDVYNWPFYMVTRGMYLWRCGTPVSADFAGSTFQHEACHLEDARLGKIDEQNHARRDGTGGWHDAGDYNKYTVNAAFTVGMMLAAWEHFRDRLDVLALDLPESENATPDFLDEVRWELEWLLKMQADDGSVCHKLSAVNFNAFELPERESAPRYFSPWGSAATASFAAVMAQAARVFHPFDAEFAARCLAAADKSYQFLRAHPGDHRPDQSAFHTGGYDSPDGDDRLWAAAELWEATGDEAYLRDFEQRLARSQASAIDSDWDWGNLRNLGAFTYLLSQRAGRDPAVVARVRDDVIHSADDIVQAAAAHPYARPLGERYYWGCNGTIARQAMNLHVAQLLTGDPKYRDAMLDGLHYLFGRNPFGRSFVTGLGHQPPLHPHDRRSGGDDVDAPWPGYLVGGAWPKETDWHDDQDDYRTNEIAINWNGALIYALAAFLEPQSFADSVARAQSATATPPSSRAED